MTGSEQRNGVEDTVRDYVARPRDSGYRAVHLWTRYGGWRVEAQLRTQLQHAWAAGVEELTALTGVDYKSGDGSLEVHAWLRLLSRSYALADAGVTPDRGFHLEFAAATASALASIIQDASRQKDSHG